mgnify:CR=1 FL=1
MSPVSCCVEVIKLLRSIRLNAIKSPVLTVNAINLNCTADPTSPTVSEMYFTIPDMTLLESVSCRISLMVFANPSALFLISVTLSVYDILLKSEPNLSDDSVMPMA